MWYKLNEMLSVVALVVIVGGAAIYGLVLFIEAPPLIRQESDGPSPYQQQASEALEKQIRELQDQQAEILREAAEHGRRATSPSYRD
jgi:hypothetical protein